MNTTANSSSPLRLMAYQGLNAYAGRHVAAQGANTLGIEPGDILDIPVASYRPSLASKAAIPSGNIDLPEKVAQLVQYSRQMWEQLNMQQLQLNVQQLLQRVDLQQVLERLNLPQILNTLKSQFGMPVAYDANPGIDPNANPNHIGGESSSFKSPNPPSLLAAFSSVASVPPGDGDDDGPLFKALTPQELMDHLQSKYGLSREQAAGFVGNFMLQSSLHPPIVQGGKPGAPNGGPGYGLMQWSGTRRKKFHAFAAAHGLDPQSREASLAFLDHELSGDYNYLIDRLKTATSIEEATQVVFQDYQCPGDSSLADRIKNARVLR